MTLRPGRGQRAAIMRVNTRGDPPPVELGLRFRDMVLRELASVVREQTWSGNTITQI